MQSFFGGAGGCKSELKMAEPKPSSEQLVDYLDNHAKGLMCEMEAVAKFRANVDKMVEAGVDEEVIQSIYNARIHVQHCTSY